MCEETEIYLVTLPYHSRNGCVNIEIYPVSLPYHSGCVKIETYIVSFPYHPGNGSGKPYMAEVLDTVMASTLNLYTWPGNEARGMCVCAMMSKRRNLVCSLICYWLFREK